MQELTKEDKFGVMRAEGGRDVRRTATLDSIQTKISEQRYVTVAEAEVRERERETTILGLIGLYFWRHMSDHAPH